MQLMPLVPEKTRMAEDARPRPRTLSRIDFYIDSPVGGAWGHGLTQAAPGTATSESWNTNWAEAACYRRYHEYYGCDYFEPKSDGKDQNGSHLSRTITLLDSDEEQAKLIASWIITMNVEFWVALEAESLATGGLTQDQREQSPRL
jgi:hypothetical protein